MLLVQVEAHLLVDHVVLLEGHPCQDWYRHLNLLSLLIHTRNISRNSGKLKRKVKDQNIPEKLHEHF